ncbi:MAG: hypothetical protein V4695_10715 [Pseudomonadota bacterium]
MSKIKTGLFSAVITCFVAFLNYTELENFSGIVRLLAIVLSGLAIGMCQGVFVDREMHMAIGLGAFYGMLVLMSPVIVVTYGFALMSLPLLAVFAMLVFFGAQIGNDLRIKSCRLG